MVERLIAERRASGADKFDEVWEGVYVMSPLANMEHQRFATDLCAVFHDVVRRARLGDVYQGANVSDRRIDWIKNYRCPDIAVYLKANAANNCGTHMLGGPEIAVEVLSPGDRAFEKLPFYAAVSTREVIIVERNPWGMYLFGNNGAGEMKELERIAAGDGMVMRSRVLPLRFQILSDEMGLRMEVDHDDGRQWEIPLGG